MRRRNGTKLGLVLVPLSSLWRRAPEISTIPSFAGTPPADPPPPSAQSYIGSARCGECHGPDLPAAFHGTYFDDWMANAHGRSTEVAPSETVIVADHDDNGASDFTDGLDLGTLPEWQAFTVAGGAAADVAPRLAFDAGNGTYRVQLGASTFVLDEVLGSGRTLQTYLTRIDRSRYTLPVSFHTETDTWEPMLIESWYRFDDANADGHWQEGERILGVLYADPVDTPVSLGRTADSYEVRCAGCHVTGIESFTRLADGQFEMQFHESGVGCEACHGPGGLHAEIAGGDFFGDSAILDPGEFGEEAQRDLCMSCHTRGRGVGSLAGQAVEFPWHPDGRSFAPGDPLADFLIAEQPEYEPVHRLQGNDPHGSDGSGSYGIWSHDCQHCHTAHNTTNLALVAMRVETPHGGRFSELHAMSGAPGSGGLLGDATDGIYRDTCEVCHTRTEYFRNDGSVPAGHFDGQDCRVCHSHENGFSPEGHATGGQDCRLCHQPLVDAMEGPDSDWLHKIEDTDPHYPTDGSPLECLSCHVDHDLFSPADGASERGTNLRVDIDVVPADLADAANSDFCPTGAGGICLSCHSTERDKSFVREDGSTKTPAVPFPAGAGDQVTAYDSGAHGGAYVVASDFRDGTQFLADCSKCHDDDLDPKSGVDAQVGDFAFGLHRSSHHGMLAQLGFDGVLDPMEEQFCYRCHSQVGDGVGGDVKTTPGFDWYGVQALSSRSERVFTDQQKAFRHAVEASHGLHSPFEGHDPFWNPSGNRHVECADCHNSHATGPARSFQFDGTFLQPTNPTNLIAGTPMQDVWGVDVTWPGEWLALDGATDFTRLERSTHTWMVCIKCHSPYAYGATPPVGQTDSAFEFNPNNTSYHAVIGNSKALVLPADSYVAPWSWDSPMSCSDCHTSDDPNGAQGPHGSIHGGILAGAVNDNTGQPGTQDHLCFKCHSYDVYSRDASNDTSLTGFSGDGDNLHREHAREEHFSEDRDCTCTDCHSAVPHGYFRRALLAVREDPAPYNNGFNGMAAADVPNWPAPGNWRESSCSNSPCH